MDGNLGPNPYALYFDDYLKKCQIIIIIIIKRKKKKKEQEKDR